MPAPASSQVREEENSLFYCASHSDARGMARKTDADREKYGKETGKKRGSLLKCWLNKQAIKIHR